MIVPKLVRISLARGWIKPTSHGSAALLIRKKSRVDDDSDRCLRTSYGRLATMLWLGRAGRTIAILQNNSLVPFSDCIPWIFVRRPTEPLPYGLKPSHRTFFELKDIYAGTGNPLCKECPGELDSSRRRLVWATSHPHPRVSRV